MNSFLKIVSVAAVCFASFAFAKEEKIPKAVFDETVHNFGAISRITTVEYAFSLRNEGNATLRIEKVVPDCACTIAKYPKKIKPGKTGEITLSVTASETTIETYAIVLTNEPAKKNKHRLHIRAHFLGPLDIIPGSSIQFIDEEPSAFREVTIRNYDPTNPLDITDIKFDADSAEYIDASYRTIETGREYIIRFTLKKVPPSGKAVFGSASVVTIRGTGQRGYSFSIYIHTTK